MKNIIAVIGILAGIVLGVYVGVWLCLAGGIIGLVSAGTILLASGHVAGSLIAWSIIKIVCAGVLGTLSAYVLIIPSWILLIKNKRVKL